MPTLFAAFDAVSLIIPVAVIVFMIINAGIRSFSEHASKGNDGSSTPADPQKELERFLKDLGVRKRQDQVDVSSRPNPSRSESKRNRNRNKQRPPENETVSQRHLHSSFEGRSKGGLRSTLELKESEIIVTPDSVVDISVDEKLTMPMRAISNNPAATAALLEDKQQLARWLVLGQVLNQPVGFEDKWRI